MARFHGFYPRSTPNHGSIAPLATTHYNWAMDESLTIRLGSELGRALEEAARKAGISKGELARQALAERLRKPGSLSVMSRHFGSVQGPRDLSVNKAYRREWPQKKKS